MLFGRQLLLSRLSGPYDGRRHGAAQHFAGEIGEERAKLQDVPDVGVENNAEWDFDLFQSLYKVYRYDREQ